MSPNLKLSIANFERLDKLNLLINIWKYNDESHDNHTDCSICKQYEQWCIEVAKSKWQDEFKSFAFVIAQIRTQNKAFFDFGKVSSADRNMIYHRIWKQTHWICNSLF